MGGLYIPIVLSTRVRSFLVFGFSTLSKKAIVKEKRLSWDGKGGEIVISPLIKYISAYLSFCPIAPEGRNSYRGLYLSDYK